MRANEFLLESTSALTLDKLTKREGRPERFIQLVRNLHTFNSKDGPVQLDPSEADRLAPLITKANKGSRVTVTTNTGQVIPIGNLYYDDAVFSAGKTGTQASKAGDTSVRIKPASVFGHGTPEKGQEITADLAISLGAIRAGDLGKQIANNEHLKNSGEAGQAVIEISRQIDQNQKPRIPTTLPKSALIPIQNDAFEYLGVQALVKGVADFPNSDAFYEHLGTNLDDTLLLFPATTNNPLTDSYALQNTQDGNKIFISSKGGNQGGAASSIAELKIPAGLQDDPDEAIQFVKYIQSVKPAFKQPFEAINYLKKLGKDVGPLEPFNFDDRFYQYISSIWANKDRRPVPKSLNEISPEYQDLFKLVQTSTKDSTHALFFNLRYYVKTIVHNLINGGILPTFNQKMLEILGQNFIVLKTKPTSGIFLTQAFWPTKMGGKIQFEHKDPPDKWAASMTWKLK